MFSCAKGACRHRDSQAEEVKGKKVENTGTNTK